MDTEFVPDYIPLFTLTAGKLWVKPVAYVWQSSWDFMACTAALPLSYFSSFSFSFNFHVYLFLHFYYMHVCKLPHNCLGIHLCICPCVATQLSQIDRCIQTYVPKYIYFFSNTATSHFNSVAPGKIFCTDHFCGYWKYQSRKIVVPILDVCPLPDLLSH